MRTRHFLPNCGIFRRGQISVANFFNKSLSFILISLPGTPPVGFCFCKCINNICITKNKTFESFICSCWTLVIQIKSTNFVAPHNLKHRSRLLRTAPGCPYGLPGVFFIYLNMCAIISTVQPSPNMVRRALSEIPAV